MSKWKSPQAAAREAKWQEKLRRQQLKDKLLLIGALTLVLGTFVAYLVWAFVRIEKHKGHDHHRNRQERTAQTNSAAAKVLDSGKSTPFVCHE